jgi:eukaryotic-like serine/threonine-protein kinase
VPHRPVLACGYEAVRLAIASRPPAGARLAPHDELRLDALWTSATTLLTYDPFVAHALILRLVRRARAAGPLWTVRALALHTALLAARGGWLRARAERTLAELCDRASAIEAPYERAWVAITEGMVARLSGDVQRCLEWTSRARELVRAVPALGAYELALLDALRLPAMALLGHHDAVLRSAGDLLAIARARGDRFAMLPCLHGHVTLAYLGAGSVERAARAADEAGEIARCASSPIPAYHQAWSQATIALFCGDGDRAHRVITGAWRPLRRSGVLRLEVIAGDLRYLRARCALAAAAVHRGRARARRLRDAELQARGLRASTLVSGPALADAIDARLAVLAGEGRDGRARADAAIAALRRLGLVPDGDALARWSTGQALLPIDRVYVA